MKQRFSKQFLRLLGVMVVLSNLALAACGSDSPTPLAASTGQIVPGLDLFNTPTSNPSATTVATPNTTAFNNSLPTVTAGDIPTTIAATSATASTTTGAATDTAAPATTAPAATTTTAPDATSTPMPGVNKYSSVFASYQEKAVSVQPAVKPYTITSGLTNVTNIKDFKLSDQEKQLLTKNAFVIEPAEYKQFFQAYESFRYDQIPTYVSTDSILHVYHLIFDKILRTTETKYLINDLTQLNKALYDYASSQYKLLKGTQLELAAKRELGFIAVARKLNTPKDNFAIPTEIADNVNAELKLVAAHGGFQLSPLMGSDYKEDYGQYVPRGHYTKTPELQQYFQAMIWYGRMNFRLKNDSETQTALLLAQAITNGSTGGRKASDFWNLIYEPTTFFVGNSDDLTYVDYMKLG